MLYLLLLLLEGVIGGVPAPRGPVLLLLGGRACKAPEVLSMVAALVAAVAVGGVHAGGHADHSGGEGAAAAAPCCAAAVGGGSAGVAHALKGGGRQVAQLEAPCSAKASWSIGAHRMPSRQFAAPLTTAWVAHALEKGPPTILEIPAFDMLGAALHSMSDTGRHLPAESMAAPTL